MRVREGISVCTELDGRALPVSPRYQVEGPGIPWAFVLCVSAVDLASVPDAHDMDDEDIVDDFVDDPVVTHAYAIHAVLA